eukprot:GHVS01091506.1.p1 GENE.GHVS01091506.1~~GHVS01091506.1.p1  ORF type:complete len:229 (-),score=39.79 GHVS01091506.1:739-1425(-)
MESAEVLKLSDGTEAFAQLQNIIIGRLNELKDLSCLRAEDNNQPMREHAEGLRRSLEKVDHTVRGMAHQLQTDQPLLEQIESTLTVTKQQYNNTHQVLAIASRILQHRFLPPTPSATILSPVVCPLSSTLVPPRAVHTAGSVLSCQDLNASSMSQLVDTPPPPGTPCPANRVRPSSLSVSQPPGRLRVSKVPVIAKVSDADLESLPRFDLILLVINGEASIARKLTKR